MKANIHPISRHNPFDHGNQIVISFHTIIPNLMYDLTSVLIPSDHYHPWLPFSRHLLFVLGGFDSNPLICHVYLGCISMGLVNGMVLFKDFSLVFQYMFPSKLSRRLWNSKEICNSHHMCRHLLVCLSGVLNKVIEYCAHSLGKHRDHLTVTFVHLLKSL